MTPEELAAAVRGALLDAVAAGELDLDPDDLPDPIRIERPGAGQRGDLGCSIALRLARPAGRPPFEIASLLAGRLERVEGIRGVGVAGPGFVNVTLEAGRGATAARVLREGEEFGRSDAFAGRRIDIAIATPPPGRAGGGDLLRARRGLVVAETLGRLVEAGGGTARTTEVRLPGRAAGHVAFRDGDLVDDIRTAPVALAGAPEPGAGEGLERLDAAVGRDVLRLALLRSRPTAPLTLDADLLRRRVPENPAFAVLHAHAVLAALVRPHASARVGDPDLSVLDRDIDVALGDALGDLSRAVALAGARRDPGRLVRRLEEVAAIVARWAAGGPVAAGAREGADVAAARLLLARAARLALGRGLRLCGVEPPERL